MHKISVVSRGQALGYTISLPTEDKFLTTKGELMDTLAMTLGGRAAEEVVFGEITTGAANDLEKATATAKQMIMRFGMSEELGPRTLGHDQSMPFLGREFQQQADYSDEVARQIDDEIRRIIEEAHQVAQDLLNDKREVLDTISKILMVRETIDAVRVPGARRRRARRRGLPRARREGRAASREGRPGPQQARAAFAAARAQACAREPGQPGDDLRPPGRLGELVDRDKIEQGVRLILEGIGEDLQRPGLLGTPRRVADMYEDIFSGIAAPDPAELLVAMEGDHHREMVIIRDIDFYSVCEHHLLPFAGMAHVAYIPSREGQICGLSKLARVVRQVAARPQLQERITSEVADIIVRALNPAGALVLIQAEHLCMSMRGVRTPGSKTVTSAVRGIIQSHDATRAEAFALINVQR